MPLSKQEIENHLSERCGVPVESVASILKELAELGYREAGNGFLLPGFGRLVHTLGPKRFGRNPMTGKEIEIPGKHEIRVILDSTAEDAILSQAENDSADERSPEAIPKAMILPEIRLSCEPEDLAKANVHRGERGFNNCHKIGGQPDWIQGPEDNIVCCGREMTFYGQFDSIGEEYMIDDAGIIYVFLCFSCLKAKCFVQFS